VVIFAIVIICTTRKRIQFT